MVQNTAILNEELDPALVIKRLRQEVRELKEELRLARDEEEDRGPLTEGELDRIREGVEAYAFDTMAKGDVPLPSTKSMQHIRAAFEVFRTMVSQAARGCTPAGQNVLPGVTGGDKTSRYVRARHDELTSFKESDLLHNAHVCDSLSLSL